MFVRYIIDGLCGHWMSSAALCSSLGGGKERKGWSNRSHSLHLAKSGCSADVEDVS